MNKTTVLAYVNAIGNSHLNTHNVKSVLLLILKKNESKFCNFIIIPQINNPTICLPHKNQVLKYRSLPL